jgi:hypothetical protein
VVVLSPRNCSPNGRSYPLGMWNWLKQRLIEEWWILAGIGMSVNSESAFQERLRCREN